MLGLLIASLLPPEQVVNSEPQWPLPSALLAPRSQRTNLSLPASGSRPRPLKLGRRGVRRFGTCLRGACSGHPCTSRTPLVAPSSPPEDPASLARPSSGGAGGRARPAGSPVRPPRGAVTCPRRVSVLPCRPRGHPALPPGPGGPRAAAGHAHRRVAARAEKRGPDEPGRGRAAPAGGAQRAVPRALRLPLRARRASERPGGGAAGAGAPAAPSARAGAAHRPGRGEEDRPPASRRPPGRPPSHAVAAARARDPGRPPGRVGTRGWRRPGTASTRAQREGTTEAIARIMSPFVLPPTHAHALPKYLYRFVLCPRFIQLTASILHSLCSALTPPAFVDSKALIQLLLAPHPLLLSPSCEAKRAEKESFYSTVVCLFFLLPPHLLYPTLTCEQK